MNFVCGGRLPDSMRPVTLKDTSEHVEKQLALKGTTARGRRSRRLGQGYSPELSSTVGGFVPRRMGMRRWFLSYNSQDLALMQGLADALRHKDRDAGVFFALR